MRGKWTVFGALLLALLFAPVSVRADSDGATAPVSVDVSAPTPVATSTLTATSSVPTDTPTAPPTATAPPAVPSPTDTPAISTMPPSDPTPTTPATSTATSTATSVPTSTLSAVIAPEIECELAGGVSVVEQGGAIDYSCRIGIDLTRTSPVDGSARVDWTISSSAGPGWTVQIRGVDGTWGQPDAGQRFEQAIDLATSSLQFDLRVNRGSCVTGAPSVQVSGLAAIQLLDAAGQADGAPVQGASAATLVPKAAPIPEPDLAFAGSLDFGQVSPAEWGDSATASGAITLVASGLSASCGDWRIILSGSILQSANGSTIPVGNLSLIAVNGVPLASGSCGLAGGCVVGQPVSGPQAEDTETYELSLTLTVPPGTLTGSFSSSISASIEDDWLNSKAK